jgi:hypothetical protein
VARAVEEKSAGLADDMENFPLQWALPRSIRGWTLTTLPEELVKIGTKVVCHARHAIFQLAEVAVPPELFAAILGRSGRIRAACASLLKFAATPQQARSVSPCVHGSPRGSIVEYVWGKAPMR